MSVVAAFLLSRILAGPSYVCRRDEERLLAEVAICLSTRLDARKLSRNDGLETGVP